MRRVCLIALILVFAGCKASPEKQARNVPPTWQHSQTLSNCGSTDGRFDELGAPAAQNSEAEARSIWPKMGSLSAMVQNGANGMSRKQLSTVSIEIIDGHPHFKAFGADGAEVPLIEREWWCEGRALMTRVVLGTVSSDNLPEERDESVLRLWRASDGALIAQQTIESITPGTFGSSSNHKPITRSYFRFASAAH